MIDMGGSRQVFCILIALVAWGITLRVVGTLNRNRLFHDEAVSYLVATGHLGEHSSVERGGSPFGELVQASEWQDFLSLDNTLIFRKNWLRFSSF